PVVDQVNDAVHDLMRAKRPGKVTIILEPAHLGSVTVTVKHSGNRFTADIQASDPVVSQQLADNKQDLVQAAESRGLSM
ncbi:flagellar hook-length control protein FliK, partial [Acinetobacter baumannii]